MASCARGARTPEGGSSPDGGYKCASCKAQTAVTAGTLFDRRRSPLAVWFAACWMFASQKDGVSALSLQRALEIGSYPTAWAMLHRLRAVLVRPDRNRLTGTVEVDETYFGGEEPGLRGGRQKGKKVLVGIVVERIERKGFGRMAILADGSAESLHPFVTANVEPGATVVTDGWSGYQGIGALLPGVHRVASLAKRWVLETHQGSIGAPHLQSYLEGVRLPLQPTPPEEPRAPLLRGARARSGPRSGALPAARRRVPVEEGAASTPIEARAPSEPGPASRRPPVEIHLTWKSRVR